MNFDPDALFKEALVSRIYDVCRRTPIDPMRILSAELDNKIFLKREDLQPIFSFKLRGAYHKISKYPFEQLKKGVVAASAGNHAQGVAYSAKHFSIPALIFMPQNTALVKIDAVKNLGARIFLEGENLYESDKIARKKAEAEGMLYIHPFNDIDVIAGQATVGLEIIQDSPELPEAVFVPVGGGGLIAGIALVLKTLAPSIKVIGVEPIDNNVMTLSMQKKQRIKLDYLNPFADGVAVQEVGDYTYSFAAKYVDDFINVSTDEICFATKTIFNDLRALPEPSGALALAGLIAYLQKNKLKNKTLLAINTGANIDFERLRFIAERTKMGAGKELLLAVRMEEKPGTLREFCQKVLAGVKISEFNYRYHEKEKALIFLGLEIANKEESKEIFQRLETEHYVYLDLTENDLAKSHLKYFVGGQSSLVEDERVFQFQFPENPKALSAFLNKMSLDWNISLFHYRNYGGDYGKILMGIQSKPSSHQALKQFLDSLNYSYKEQTDNYAYQTFFS